jgi:hypothetical protein
VRSNLEELLQDLADLRTLVASFVPVNAALARHEDTVVRQYLTIRRRFDYAAFIVGLYASFERYIDGLVEAYAHLIAARLVYAALPAKLVSKHMTKSAELLAKGRLGEGRYVAVREGDVVRNLHECLSGAAQYKLNTFAIAAHDFNLRYAEINALFAVIGIDAACERALKADAMLSWFCTLNGLESPPPDGVPQVAVEPKIQNLVERRNIVAHRGGSPDDLLGPTEMVDLLDFVEAFSRSIFAITAAAYLRVQYLNSGELTPLVLREGPYRKDRTVIVVDKPAVPLFAGQAAFILNDAAGARWGRILELKLDDAVVTRVDETTESPLVGIRVDFRCPNGTEMHVLQAEDDVVWTPEATLLPAPTADSLALRSDEDAAVDFEIEIEMDSDPD